MIIEKEELTVIKLDADEKRLFLRFIETALVPIEEKDAENLMNRLYECL